MAWVIGSIKTQVSFLLSLFFMVEINIRASDMPKAPRVSMGNLLAHLMLFLLSGVWGLSLFWQNDFRPIFYYLLGNKAQAVITQSVPASYQNHLAKDGGRYLQIEFKQVPIRFVLPDQQVIETKVDINTEAAYMLTGKTLTDSQLQVRYLIFRPQSVIALAHNEGWVSVLYFICNLIFVGPFCCYVAYAVFCGYRRFCRGR